MANTSQGKNPSDMGNLGDRAKDAAQHVGNQVREAAGQGADMARETATNVADRAREMATNVGDRAREMASNVGNQARQAASAAGQRADDATHRLGSTMESLAGSVREHAPNSGYLGTAAGRVADSLESGGRYLREEGIRGVASDMTELIKRNPIPAVLFGIGVGFLLARATSSRS
jgi:hypothetical protein